MDCYSVQVSIDSSFHVVEIENLLLVEVAGTTAYEFLVLKSPTTSDSWNLSASSSSNIPEFEGWGVIHTLSFFSPF